MVENYRKLLRVKEQLHSFYRQDAGILRNALNVQCEKIMKLQVQIERNGKRNGNERYNLRELSPESGLSAQEKLDKALSELSYTDPAKKLKISELEKKQMELEKAIKEQEQEQIGKQKMNAPSSETTEIDLTNEQSSESVAEQKTEENDFVQLIQSEFKCSICQEILVDAVITDCRHIYCKRCLAEWEKVGANPSCPLCRKTDTRRVNAVAIDSFLTNCASLLPSSAVLQNWQRLKRKTEALDSQSKTKRRRLSFESDTETNGYSNDTEIRNYAQVGPGVIESRPLVFRSLPSSPTPSLVLSLDGEEDIGEVLELLRNSAHVDAIFGGPAVGSTCNSSTTVVDLTEDDAD